MSTKLIFEKEVKNEGAQVETLGGDTHDAKEVSIVRTPDAPKPL